MRRGNAGSKPGNEDKRGKWLVDRKRAGAPMVLLGWICGRVLGVGMQDANK